MKWTEFNLEAVALRRGVVRKIAHEVVRGNDFVFE